MKPIRITVVILMVASLAGCSKSSTTPTAAKAPDPGPDNAFTRYTENLVRDEQRAKWMADKANSVIAKQDRMTREASNQAAEQPQ